MSTVTGYPPNESPGRDAAVLVRRFVNDEIAVRASRYGAGMDSEFEFVCECGDLSCPGRARLTLAAYHASPPGSVSSH